MKYLVKTLNVSIFCFSTAVSIKTRNFFYYIPKYLPTLLAFLYSLTNNALKNYKKKLEKQY